MNPLAVHTQDAIEPRAVSVIAREVLDAEMALLGILLFQPELTLDVARTLTPLDFYGAEFGQSPNARIFEVLRDDAERGVETEPHVLSLQLAEALGEVGGGAYIGTLIEKAGSSSALPHLVRQLATEAAKRRLVRELVRPDLQPAELSRLLEAETRKADDLAARTRPVRATPFDWIDPEQIPRREWLYDRHLIRRFVSATFSPGGVGKTIQAIVEALAMVTGRPLLGAAPAQPLSVWLINLEDPREEMERRVAAVCRHYNIKSADIAGRLFIDSGRDCEVIVARSTRQGVEICSPVVRQLEREIHERQIDALIVDPFVASHDCDENSNGAINVVVKQWAGIAERTNCAVDLIHHVTKGGSTPGEATVEHGRGASALLAGVRSARVLNGMTDQQAAEWGIEERRLYFRVENGKANLAPPGARTRWRRLVEVDLENGPSGFSDLVGVPVCWEPPSAFEGISNADLAAIQQKVATGDYRASEQASAWAGYVVAEVLGWDISDLHNKARVKALLRGWLGGGALKIEQRMDPKKREEKPFVSVGNWVQP